MYGNYIYRDINEALPDLMRELLACPEQPSRAGNTREMTHVGITLTEPWRREILIPARGAKLVAQIAETAWVLAGRNDVEWLSHYLPRAADFSDDGVTWRSGYGPRLRKWSVLEENDKGQINRVVTDQLAYVVSELRANPATRQAVIQLWDPAVDGQPGDFKDRACNNWLHFLARDGRLDLHVAIRSNDAMWGWSGINAFEWSVLLEVVAGLTGLNVGALHFSVSSFHLYERHWDKAKRIVLESQRCERIGVQPSPQFLQSEHSVEWFDTILDRWFRLEYDIRTGSPMVAGYIDRFPEPMLKSWLIVLEWWWNGQFNHSISDLDGTALGVAAKMGPKPPWQQPSLGPGKKDGTSDLDLPEPMSLFLDAAVRLHNEKHEAYGDSWKRRGEYMILANIARKVDRLSGGKETSDESQADTAMDLMIYLAKYRTWLDDQIDLADRDNHAHPDSPAGRELGTQSDDSAYANDLLVRVEKDQQERYPIFAVSRAWRPPLSTTVDTLVEMIVDSFDKMEENFQQLDPHRAGRVDAMLAQAYRLARYRWEASHSETDAYLGADHE